MLGAASVLAVLLVACGAIAQRARAERFLGTVEDNLLYADLVIRGTITSYTKEVGTYGEISPNSPHVADPFPITMLDIDVLEVINGYYPEKRISVAVPGDYPDGEEKMPGHIYKVGLTYNYSVGDEVIMCLQYSQRMRGGSFTINSDLGRYLKKGDTYTNQAVTTLTKTLDEMRAMVDRLRSHESVSSISGETNSKWVGRAEVVRIAAGVDLRLAREEAVREVERLSALPAGTSVFFGLGIPSRLRNATLGEPFFYYWAGDEFAGFEDADPSMMLDFMRGFTVRFAVILDGKTLGTLNVTKNGDTGEYRVLTRSEGSVLYDRVAVVRSRYPDSAGWTVVVANTGLAGTYFLLKDGSGSVQLGPADRFAAHIYELDPDEDNELQFVPLREASVRIKDELRKMRQQGGHQDQGQGE